MVTRVLDTSVVVKWFLEEEGTDRADLLLQQFVEGTARAVVPSSLFSELANVFWVHRRDGLTEAEAQAFWGELVHLPLTPSKSPTNFFSRRSPSASGSRSLLTTQRSSSWLGSWNAT